VLTGVEGRRWTSDGGIIAVLSVVFIASVARVALCEWLSRPAALQSDAFTTCEVGGMGNTTCDDDVSSVAAVVLADSTGGVSDDVSTGDTSCDTANTSSVLTTTESLVTAQMPPRAPDNSSRPPSESLAASLLLLMCLVALLCVRHFALGALLFVTVMPSVITVNVVLSGAGSKSSVSNNNTLSLRGALVLLLVALLHSPMAVLAAMRSVDRATGCDYERYLIVSLM
jgi:hypothetical protein